MRKWKCRSCGLIYDEALGLPEDGIAPGTRFELLGDDQAEEEASDGRSVRV